MVGYNMKILGINIGVYKVLVAVFILGLIFVLSLPKAFDMHAQEKTERCLQNMSEVKSVVERYMHDRDEVFTGTVSDLTRQRLLEKVAFEECPEGRAGDKYAIHVNPEDRKVTIRCVNVSDYPDHVLAD